VVAENGWERRFDANIGAVRVKIGITFDESLKGL